MDDDRDLRAKILIRKARVELQILRIRRARMAVQYQEARAVCDYVRTRSDSEHLRRASKLAHDVREALVRADNSMDALTDRIQELQASISRPLGISAE